MAARSISETRQFRYLLDLSSPAEREQLEAEYFEDEDAFQEMLAAEDDLIDAYARGELAGEERRRFEESFVSSLRGRDRVQFARAFAVAVSATPSVQIKPGTWLDVFKIFQSPALLRTATIAAVIVLVAGLAWLVVDRRRMTNELSVLRTESAELKKQAETLQRSSDAKRTRTAEISAPLAELRAEPAKPRHYERRTIATRQTIASSRHDQAEEHPNNQDASRGTAFETKITTTPIRGRKFEDLLVLEPGTFPAARADAKTTLGSIWWEPINTYSLKPRNTNSSSETIIRIQSSLTWIRFRITLETATNHEHYRVNIGTTAGLPVKSLNCIDPLTPNQTIIDTPVFAPVDLPSGDYVLVLMGKEYGGSFVKVADYSFKVIRD